MTRTAPVSLSGVVMTTSPVSCTSPHICTAPLNDLLPDQRLPAGRGGSFFLTGSCGYEFAPVPQVLAGILIAKAAYGSGTTGMSDFFLMPQPSLLPAAKP